MEHPPSATTLGRFVLATVALTATAALGGCAAITETEEVPPTEKEATNVGVNAEIGAIEAENLLIISSEKGAPGRLLGNVYTSADEPLEVTFSDSDEEIVITVSPGADEPNREGYDFEANEHVFETTDDRPGGLVEVSVVAAEDSEVLSIPVLDGSLDQYRPYLPESGVEPAP